MKPEEYVADRIRKIPPSEIRAMLAKVKTMPDAIDLTIGEPDFEPFEPIKKAVVEALYKPCYREALRPCGYPPGMGIYDLREALAEKLRKENGVNVTPDEIAITNGGQQGIFLSITSVLNPGEEILLPDPGFVAYGPTVRIANAVPKYYPLNEENEFKPVADEIRKLITEKTRAILINTPHNPTGAVYSRRDLKEVAEVALEHNLVIISDECYEKFVYEGEHVSIASLDEDIMRQTITVFSFSKTYGMTGLRLGYLVAPAEFMKHFGKVLLYNSAGVCAPIQVAGIVALKQCGEHVNKIVMEYRERRDYAYKRLNEMSDIHSDKPHGAFYIFPNIGKYGDSRTFSSRLLSAAHVGVVPGVAFGIYGEYHIRIYLARKEILEEAFGRWEKHLKT